MASYERELETGIARFLTTNIDGIGHDLDDPWEDQDTLPEWPAYFRVPPTPNKLVAIVLGSPTFMKADIETPVQIRVRGEQDGVEDDVLDLDQAILDLFYPRGFPLVHTWIGNVRIASVSPISRARLGPDTERRWETSRNFRFRGRRVATGC